MFSEITTLSSPNLPTTAMCLLWELSHLESLIERHTGTWLFLPISVPAVAYSVNWAQCDQGSITSGAYEHFASVWSVYVWLSVRSSDFTKPSCCNFIARSLNSSTDFVGIGTHVWHLWLFSSLMYGFFGAGYVAMVGSFRTGFGLTPSRQILCNRFNQAYVGLR
jgi:hypothetical protein